MNTPQTTPPSDSRETLWALIKDMKFAMFTTRQENRQLRARPMTTQNSALDEDGSLWFFMSRRGEPVADLVADSIVNVAYADPGEDTYVSVSGEAHIVESMSKKQQLWTRAADAWFPGGIDDPDLALVEVKIANAEYWDVKASKLVQIYQMAKAAITGKPPAVLGQHGEVKMR